MKDRSTPGALSCTWEAATTYRECGVITSITTDIVTLNRDGTALVNACPAHYARAVRLLDNSDTARIICETLPTLPLSNPVTGNVEVPVVVGA